MLPFLSSVDLCIFFLRDLVRTNPTGRDNYDTFAEDFPTRTNDDFENFGETSSYSREWMNKITSEDFRKDYTDRFLRVSFISFWNKNGNFQTMHYLEISRIDLKTSNQFSQNITKKNLKYFR
jgi:hypothetical protein